MLTLLSAAIVLQVAVVQQGPPQQTPVAPAQVSRAGRHALELGFSVSGSSRASTTVAPGGVTFDAEGGAFGGSLSYSYWAADRVAVQVHVTAISADASVSVTGSGSVTQASSVGSFLVGLKVQPFALPGAERLRPFVSGAAGAYIGDASGVSTGLPTVVAARSETVAGARVAAGFDVLIGRRFTLGAGGAYRFMGDFREPIGGRTDYSGAEVTFSFGVLIGHGR